MTRFPTWRAAAALALATFACATAQAQLFRAYLSVDGADTNPCTLSQPCRLLPAALNAIASGGEVWMLDSANYNTGTVTINKSATILAVPGVVGSIVAINGGSAIEVPASGLRVALRNLTIVPYPGVQDGIGVYVSGASTVSIEDSLLANLPGPAVFMNGPGKLAIARTVIRGTTGDAVTLRDGAVADIVASRFIDNTGTGVYASTTTFAIPTMTIAVLSDVVISGGYSGVFGRAFGSSAATRIYMTRSTVSRTTYALDSETMEGGSSVVALSETMVTGNSRAWYQTGYNAIVRSLGNNHIADNASSFGTLTTSALQ